MGERRGLGTGRPMCWRGRTGRSYGLWAVQLDTFSLEDGGTYLIALGSHLLWAGSEADLVTDPESRARFRLAMSCADRSYRLSADLSDVDRMTALWDLEGAEPEADRTAA